MKGFRQRRVPYLAALALGAALPLSSPSQEDAPAPIDPAFLLVRPIDLVRTPRVVAGSLPLGSENGAFSYNAQPFGEHLHLGDDWNGIGGWNSDLADPVHVIADGLVLYTGTPSAGWGKMVIVQHALADGTFMQSAYAHLEAIDVAPGSTVHRGRQIGAVGSAAGRYLAHLHLEIRDLPSLGIGTGYHAKPLGRLSPTGFLDKFRPEEPTPALPAPSSIPPEHVLMIKDQQGAARVLRQ